jgi:hypothetical protein
MVEEGVFSFSLSSSDGSWIHTKTGFQTVDYKSILINGAEFFTDIFIWSFS